MGIVEVAKNKDRILETWAGKPRPCPECGKEYHSIFDTLYIEAYGRCYMCDPSSFEEINRRADNIFEIL